MAKKDKISAENEVVQDAQNEQEAAAQKAHQEEEAARQEKIAELNEREATIKAELASITAEKRTLGASRAAPRGPRGVGAFIKALIVEGLDNKTILERVAIDFPLNFTNGNCVNWYRNALKLYPETNGVKPGKKAQAQLVMEHSDEETAQESAQETNQEAA